MEKPPYPSDVNGLPIMPTDLGCYEDCRRIKPRIDTHHLAFERRHYKTRNERNFRRAGAMLAEICVCKHVDLHCSYGEPEKPSDNAMHLVTRGLLIPKTDLQAGVILNIRRLDG